MTCCIHLNFTVLAFSALSCKLKPVEVNTTVGDKLHAIDFNACKKAIEKCCKSCTCYVNVDTCFDTVVLLTKIQVNNLVVFCFVVDVSNVDINSDREYLVNLSDEYVYRSKEVINYCCNVIVTDYIEEICKDACEPFNGAFEDFVNLVDKLGKNRVKNAAMVLSNFLIVN